MTNTKIYCQLLRQCLQMPCEENKHDIGYELIGVCADFLPAEHIEGSSEKYIEHELDWYLTKDLNIKGHAGIENNKIWQKCATSDGHINSNYGWCIYSAENGFQFEHVISALCNDQQTKQAVMIYTRPSIHTECCDNVHARYDMICTCYTNTFIRNNKLIHSVHMRSNDIWNGLRNDLSWQQYVQLHILTALKEKQPDKFQDLIPGNIIWHADSLHLYNSCLDKAKKFLFECH